MKTDVVLTTKERGVPVQKVIGQCTVTPNTNYRQLLESLADQHFSNQAHHVRVDLTLPGFIAVAANGDTIHLPL